MYSLYPVEEIHHKVIQRNNTFVEYILRKCPTKKYTFQIIQVKNGIVERREYRKTLHQAKVRYEKI